MRLNLLYFFALCFASQLTAQSVINDGLTSKSVVYANNYYKTFVNPSLLSNLEYMQVGIYNGNRYLLKELQSNGLSFMSPFKHNNYLGLGLCRNGNIYFGNYHFVMAVAKRVEKNLSLGASFNYDIWMQGRGYRTISHFDANFSLNYIIKDVVIGMSINNMFSFFYDNEYMYPEIRIGMGYNMNEYLLYFVEFDKYGINDFAIVGGLSCIFQDKLTFSIGTAGKRNIMALGVAVKHNKYNFEIDCSYHIVLGLTPSLCITKSF